MTITENFKKLRAEVPENVKIVLAVKTRTKDEVLEAVNAGAIDLGENYVQEAENIKKEIDSSNITWHMIGHVQSNKINKVLELFDVIQTVDSLKKANKINSKLEGSGKKVDVMIEVNIADEDNKAGVSSNYDDIEKLVKDISRLDNLRLVGLMTMGPFTDNPEELRPYFRKMKEIFDKIKSLGIRMDVLSMGMSDSYKIAIEEGSNMIRVGTTVFGSRNS